MKIKQKEKIVNILIGKTAVGLIDWIKKQDKISSYYLFTNFLGKDKHTVYRFYPKREEKSTYLTMSYYKNKSNGELINTIHGSDVPRVNDIINAITCMEIIREGEIKTLRDMLNLITALSELFVDNDKVLDEYSDIYEELIYFKQDVQEEGYFIDTMIDDLFSILEDYQ